MTDVQAESTADQIIAVFDKINEKVDAMRAKRINDPDSLGDKLLKFALPSVAGFVAGKLFTFAWNRSVGRNRKAAMPAGTAGAGSLGDGVVDEKESLMMSVLFSALSSAVGAAVSQLSDRGSQAIVDRRHRRRND
ncbi:DUF4235 domain-containing protein [Bifidobacterium biavatii]|nr:DUF4235 domain-containing protein [Bifidobacterium biavatii]